MQPISPVLPGSGLKEVTFAKDQPEYNSLPSIKFDDGIVLTRWKLGFLERLRVLIFGDLYLQSMTFNNPLQPVWLQVERPEIVNTK